MVDVAEIDGLRTQLRGPLLCPGQDGYERRSFLVSSCTSCRCTTSRPDLPGSCTGLRGFAAQRGVQALYALELLVAEFAS
jgi:hypothetical protein